jgi:hypothetical protein
MLWSRAMDHHKIHKFLATGLATDTFPPNAGWDAGGIVIKEDFNGS